MSIFFCNVTMVSILYVHAKTTGWNIRPWPKTVILKIKINSIFSPPPPSFSLSLSLYVLVCLYICVYVYLRLPVCVPTLLVHVDETIIHTGKPWSVCDGHQLGKSDALETYNYFRDCFDETCGLEMEELHCMRSGVNVTCQLCCASSHCNADAFSYATALSTHRPSHVVYLAVLVMLVLAAEINGWL